jgi:hypothetical protein
MLSPIPFSITPDAEDYLRNRLKEMPPAAQCVLMMTMSQNDGQKPPRWLYEGQSFILACFDSAESPKAEYIESELFNRRVAIESDAMKQLTGHTLSLHRVDARYGFMNVPRYVLVADSVPEPSVSTFAADGSSENIKSNLSGAALTILGGFTGIGVIWIVAAIIVNTLKIPDDKFLPLTFPLFVVGWIVGAIVSFFFFRSLFKTDGRTKFTQEQKQRKYLGYGGVDADLSWWIFLGIPIPLIIVLVFVLEQFARTVGQKTAVVFVAIMIISVPVMYFCDRIPRRIILRLGLLGWVLTIVGGYLFFKIHGP